MYQGQTLEQLLAVPDAQRDINWENHFFVAFTNSNVKLMFEEPQQGPDGWPYLIVETGEGSTEPAQKVIQWLADKGIGLVVNPRKEYPDYVFTYGMLWNFRQTGYFYLNADEMKTGEVILTEGQKLTAGEPSEQFLPPFVRKVLKQFWLDQGVMRPRVLCLSLDEGKNYDLVLSLNSIGNPPEADHQNIAEALSWFLPPQYSLLLMKEEGLPPFYDL